LRYGKAVLCEKPVAMNAAEAEEMQAAARAAGLLYGVAQNLSFQPESGMDAPADPPRAYGKPQLAHAQYSYPATQAPRTWINGSYTGVRRTHCGRWGALHRCGCVMFWVRMFECQYGSAEG